MTPQFRTTIDGLRIHFLHARSSRSDAFPLILTHGWPGSVVEFLDVLPSLTDDGFHCVVPSLPARRHDLSSRTRTSHRAEAAARFTDIRYWSTPATGGHFPALEKPESVAAELSTFFALIR